MGRRVRGDVVDDTERRDLYGLEAGDDLEASDHYIVVADLKKRDCRPAASPSSSRKAADQRCPTWKTRRC